MDKESIYELQKIDCNCNNCGYMLRDIATYNEVILKDKADQLWFFRRKKARYIWKARKNKDAAKREQAIKQATSLTFTYFPQTVAINYGHCNKFSKPVTFLPNVMQLDTQQCFVHRKDLKPL